jgi:hypothetical protein
VVSKFLRNLAALGAMILVLGACGSTSSVVVSTTPTSTLLTLPPTRVALPTPGQPVDPIVTAYCFGPQANTWQATQFGDLVFAPVFLGPLTYPSVMLPDGTPLNQPFKMAQDNVPTSPGTGYVDFSASPATNPTLTGGSKGAGFVLNVCNVSSSARHVLQSVRVHIDSFAAYGGQLNQWNWCDGSIDSHHNPSPQGCGGASAMCVCFSAQFPATAGAGAEVTASQTEGSRYNPGDGKGNFPYVLDPGKTSIQIMVTTVAPTAPGRYVFDIGVTYDDHPLPVYAQTSAPEVLLAPVAHQWSGMTCQNTPSLLAQITPTTPETYYICSH